MAAFGYCRVSTTRAAEEGESLATQRRMIEGKALMLGLKLDEVFVERGVSGSIPFGDRPQGRVLLDRLKPGDIVIAAKLDRCFRSASDALNVIEAFKKKKISLYLLDLGDDVASNGISKLILTILAAVAEAERDRIRERITDVKRDQKSHGRYLGGSRPFGWKRGADGNLVPVAAEQDAIQSMRRMQVSGASLRAISAEMRERGHNLSHVAVQRVLRDAAKEEGEK